MEVKVTSEPEGVPEWARPTATQDEVRMATQKQLTWIHDMSTTKDLSSLSDEQRAALQQPPEFWQEETTRLSRDKAGRMIDALKPLPYRPKDKYEPTRHMAERFALGIPRGRYAVDADSGELRFYQVWVSKDGKVLKVYVCHGPDESDLRYQKTTMTVLNKIKAAGIREAAIRFGMEIGACSNCGRRLTNRISRELGIGPVCGGRMFGDDFKDQVRDKRTAIIARGEDPDEELE